MIGQLRRGRMSYTCARCGDLRTRSEYSIGPEGEYRCDACSLIIELTSMSNAHKLGEPYGVYPSVVTVGGSIRTWPGGHLGSITAVGDKPHPFTLQGRQGDRRYHCHVIDVDGNYWYGWLAEGVASTLKPKRTTWLRRESA